VVAQGDIRRVFIPSPVCLGVFIPVFLVKVYFLGLFLVRRWRGLRGYLFTDRDRERLRAWLESGVEDDGTRMLFVAVRRNLNRIAHDVGLLARVARGLQAEGRWDGRARLPGRLGELAREIEEQARLHGRKS